MEAADRLGVGRTKAYLMTQEWRTTGGRSGLPVVDLGHTLRVPRRALEKMAGGPLSETTRVEQPDSADTPGGHDPGPAAHEASHPPPSSAGSTPPPPARRRSRRSKKASPDQLDLFDPNANDGDTDDG